MVWGFWKCFTNPSVFSTSFPSTAKGLPFSAPSGCRDGLAWYLGPWGKIKCSKCISGSQYMKMYLSDWGWRWKVFIGQILYHLICFVWLWECPHDA